MKTSTGYGFVKQAERQLQLDRMIFRWTSGWSVTATWQPAPTIAAKRFQIGNLPSTRPGVMKTWFSPREAVRPPGVVDLALPARKLSPDRCCQTPFIASGVPIPPCAAPLSGRVMFMVL